MITPFVQVTNPATLANHQQTMKQLPNNALGWSIGLLLFALCAIVPFTLAFWLIGMIAPLWVNIPLSLLITVVIHTRIVKYKD